MNRIIVVDFGGQYTQLIARRVREAHVYCEIIPFDAAMDRLIGADVRGYILAGGPNSVNDPGVPMCDPALLDLGKPILGICYGAQLMAKLLGGIVSKPETGEYGGVDVSYDTGCKLFSDLDAASTVWMSHNDAIVEMPPGFVSVAHTPHCPIAAMAREDQQLYALQFHPEVQHTKLGFNILKKFLYDICHCAEEWVIDDLVSGMIAGLKAEIGDRKVLSALSGGVDSAVASVLVHKAVGDNLTCIFVDHGMLRKNEAEQVLQVYRDEFGMNLIFVDAKERFLAKLKGVTDPEEKRKIIGTEFIRVFEEEAAKIGSPEILVQGTIYPDIIESGVGHANTIKSHHNVGGLPENMAFTKIVEPLRSLFKDEVRALGTSLGIPASQVWRQPFPGPGLAVRILGEITPYKLKIVQNSDAILREEIAAAGLERDIWQYFTVLPNVRSVGVMGDGRTYDELVAIRAVTSSDAMTVDFARIPYDILAKIASRIVAEVDHVNRVVYDITSKPPGTIEWE